MTTLLNEKIDPWYRHRWPWLLMAGPFIVVIAGLFTAYLAATSNDGLVDDDYYKQGLSVNKLTARDQEASRLGLQAELMRKDLRLALGAVRDNGVFAPSTALAAQMMEAVVNSGRGGQDCASLGALVAELSGLKD